MVYNNTSGPCYNYALSNVGVNSTSTSVTDEENSTNSSSSTHKCELMTPEVTDDSCHNETNALIDRIDTINQSLLMYPKWQSEVTSIVIGYEDAHCYHDLSYDIVKTVLQKNKISEKFKHVVQIITTLDLSDIINELHNKQSIVLRSENLTKIYDVFKNVVSLTLPSSITDLSNIARLEKLQSLALITPTIPKISLASLSKLSDLHTLTLHKVDIENNELSHLKNVQFLSLATIRTIDTGFAHLENIRHLELFGRNLTDESLTNLENLKHLHTLVLICPGVTSSGIAHLKNLKSLQVLKLAGFAITNDCIEKLPNVHTLMLSGCSITDDGLVNIGQLTNLRILSIVDCPITDTCLVHLKALHLQHLDFIRCPQITNFGLATLSHIPNIQELLNVNKQKKSSLNRTCAIL